MKSNILGKIKIKVKHIPSSKMAETTVSFEDWGDKIYYCWTFNNESGRPLGGKCSPISKDIIENDELDFAIKHAKQNIENYKIDKKNIFKVEEIQQPEKKKELVPR